MKKKSSPPKLSGNLQASGADKRVFVSGQGFMDIGNTTLSANVSGSPFDKQSVNYTAGISKQIGKTNIGANVSGSPFNKGVSYGANVSTKIGKKLNVKASISDSGRYQIGASMRIPLGRKKR